MLQKASSDPWTPEDHLIIAFDSNSLGGTRTANLAPGVQFAQPVEYALRYVFPPLHAAGQRWTNGRAGI